MTNRLEPDREQVAQHLELLTEGWTKGELLELRAIDPNRSAFS